MGFSDRLKSLPLYVLPHHLVSRVVFWLTRRRSRFVRTAIRKFVNAYDVDMRDAVEPELDRYETFNEFFTRELRLDARPITSGDADIASPADGRISALGAIRDGQIFQAKQYNYSLLGLLGGEREATDRLRRGKFATIYLSPRDYHRLHMPLEGRLKRQTHVPGRLFSVAPHTVRTVPNLFARNERVIAQFETKAGLMVLVLVGAINVAAIETSWHGLVTPPQSKSISAIDYSGDPKFTLAKGEEMGRFNMGSTIIVLLEQSANWRSDLNAGDAVRMGERLGDVRSGANG